MSQHVLIDSKGFYMGDLATSTGLFDLRKDGPSAVKLFLARGEADERLVNQMIEQTRRDPQLQYLAKMLVQADPPVRLVDSTTIGDEEIENDDVIADDGTKHWVDADPKGEDLEVWRQAVKNAGGYGRV
jgi:hypothetical protein